MLTKIEQIKRGAHEKNSNCAFLQRFFGLFKVQLFFDVESNIFKEKDRYLVVIIYRIAREESLHKVNKFQQV